MPTSSEQNLDAWILSRKKAPTIDLTREVMREIQSQFQAPPKTLPHSKPFSWLIAPACLLAGIGKLTLIYQLAF